MEDEWAVHQLKTTANFATRNKLISWWVGGLNFQVEHHLFPAGYRMYIILLSARSLKRPARILASLILNIPK